MNSIVKQWYETKKNVDEMKHWEHPMLKKWEQRITEFFPSQARILDVGCGLGREAFVLSSHSQIKSLCRNGRNHMHRLFQ